MSRSETEDSGDIEGDAEVPYAYVHFPPVKTGEKFKRDIVPVSYIKKFDFAEYTQNPNQFSNTTFKIRLAPGGKKMKCFVLYAAESYIKVNEYITKRTKRFPVPKLKEPVSDTSLNSTVQETGNQEEVVHSDNASTNDIDETNLKITKARRKVAKKVKDVNNKSNEEDIVNAYVRQPSFMVDSDNEQSQATAADGNVESYFPAENTQDPEDSTFLETETTFPGTDPEAAIRAYKEQAIYFKNKYLELEKEQRREKSISQSPKSSDEAIFHLNKIFEVHSNKENAANAASIMPPASNSNKMHIRKGVMCNSLAYKDAFKAEKCQRFFTLINQGVYGFEELSKRCVKSSSRNHRELSPIKREVVEDEFYKYLITKQYPQHMIRAEMAKCSQYHHNSISAAKKAVLRENVRQLQQETNTEI